jgi:ribokinase
MNIVVVGSLNMDLVVRMPQIPKPGETLLGGVFNTFLGGKGANQAVAAARLGSHVTMIGCVGNDSFGKELRAALEVEGINTTHILVHPQAATGVALIQVDSRGQNSIAVASGANFLLTSTYVEKAMQTIGQFDVVVMPLETPLETIITAARIGSHRGAKVLLNPAPAQVLTKELLEMIYVLVPNETEMAFMSGMTLNSTEDVNRSASKLFQMGLKNLIVTMGERGAVVFAGENQGSFISAWQVQAVDTTAAGDCFVGALGVALGEGQSLQTAAEFAGAAAALSVTREGAQPSLPHREEVNHFLHERNKYP